MWQAKRFPLSISLMYAANMNAYQLYTGECSCWLSDGSLRNKKQPALNLNVSCRNRLDVNGLSNTCELNTKPWVNSRNSCKSSVVSSFPTTHYLSFKACSSYGILFPFEAHDCWPTYEPAGFRGTQILTTMLCDQHYSECTCIAWNNFQNEWGIRYRSWISFSKCCPWPYVRLMPQPIEC